MRKLMVGSLIACACAAAQSQTPAPKLAPNPAGEAAVLAPFTAMDTNRDGKLSSEEMLASRRSVWSARAGSAVSMSLAACAEGMFDDAMRSAGGAAAVTAQVAKDLRAMMLQECTRLDKNGDGQLSWEEFAGPMWSAFKMMDLDGDGFVSLSEYADQGFTAMRRAPQPNPSPELKASLDQTIQRVQAAKAQSLAQGQAAGGSTIPAQPMPAQAQGTRVQSQGQPAQAAPAAPASVFERVQSWFR